MVSKAEIFLTCSWQHSVRWCDGLSIGRGREALNNSLGAFGCITLLTMLLSHRVVLEDENREEDTDIAGTPSREE